jgi:hypothetical protein
MLNQSYDKASSRSTSAYFSACSAKNHRGRRRAGRQVSYQLYRIALRPAAGLIALTVFDVLILALTVREWRVQRPLPGTERTLTYTCLDQVDRLPCGSPF